MGKRSSLTLTVIAADALVSTADAVVNIQSLGASARSAALGNAFVAVADNGDAVFANPAGLALVKGRNLAYTNVSLLFSGRTVVLTLCVCKFCGDHAQRFQSQSVISGAEAGFPRRESGLDRPVSIHLKQFCSWGSDA